MKQVRQAGALNPEFGIGGIAELPSFNGWTDRHSTGMTFQGSRILVGARAFLAPRENYAMARFGADGKPDLTFGKDGAVAGQFSEGALSSCEDITSSPSDSDAIWLLGRAQPDPFTPGRLLLAKFDRDGQASPVEHTLEVEEGASPVRQQSRLTLHDDNILVSANFDVGLPRIYKLDAHGNPGFRGKQYIQVKFATDEVRIAALAVSGEAFLASGSLKKPDGSHAGFVARFHPDGTLDTQFGNQAGFLVLKANENNTWSHGLVVQPSGQLTVVGQSHDATTEAKRALIWQFTAQGAIDPSFNQGQPLLIGFDEGNDDGWYSAVAQPEGKLLAFGRSATDTVYAMRFNADGNVDDAFQLALVLTATDRIESLWRLNDTLLAVNATGPAGPTGMVFSFLNT